MKGIAGVGEAAVRGLPGETPIEHLPAQFRQAVIVAQQTGLDQVAAVALSLDEPFVGLALFEVDVARRRAGGGKPHDMLGPLDQPLENGPLQERIAVQVDQRGLRSNDGKCTAREHYRAEQYRRKMAPQRFHSIFPIWAEPGADPSSNRSPF